jgi:hypothetical protein
MQAIRRGRMVHSSSIRILVTAALMAAAAGLAWMSAADADAATVDRTLRSGTFSGGFRVPPNETWQFDPSRNVTIESGGNVIVEGTLIIRPGSDDIQHVLRFTGINESSFVGGGMDPVASDVGLWVVGNGRIIIEGEEKVAWGYDYRPEWRGDEVIAAPNSPGDYDGFRAVTSTPPANALGYKTELLNLTRNVRIEGTPNGYTHVFIRSNRPSTIRYAAFRYVAPDPAAMGASSDSTGRYGLHIHMSHEGSRGTLVEGLVIRDADNHAFVPHASHGITMRDTIAYNVRGEAYWWDPPEDEGDSTHDTHDLVWDRAVAARVRGASGGEHHTLGAFFLGKGRNVSVTNSVVVGLLGEGGANRSGYLWPESAEATWEFRNNRAHNNEAHGIHVWQNNEMEHVINGFTAYYNEEAGISHGAYTNSYEYKNLVLLGNGRAIHSHALGEEGDANDTQTWGNIKTNGGEFYIDVHARPAERPVRVADCDLGRVVVADGEGPEPGRYDFIRCGLEPSDFDLREAHPGDVFRVQRANGTAYRLTGTGQVTSIPAFAPLNPPDYGDPTAPSGRGRFSDDDNSIFESDIEWLAARGITRGCNPPANDRFCPDDFVSRAQMAAFLVRALEYTGGGPDRFVDDDDSVFEGDIQRLAANGVTRGCNPPTNNRFCPEDFVTRGQMAAFLVRAFGYTDSSSGDRFTDDNSSIFEEDIERLAAAGVTRGCNPPDNTRFCPNDFVTRGQMAAFLRRAMTNG